MTTESIELWHKHARPEPTAADFNVQLGCHFEEIEEMMRSIVTNDEELWQKIRLQLFALSALLKTGAMTATVHYRNGFLDSIADQVVTGLGAAHCAGMKGAAAPVIGSTRATGPSSTTTVNRCAMSTARSQKVRITNHPCLTAFTESVIHLCHINRSRHEQYRHVQSFHVTELKVLPS